MSFLLHVLPITLYAIKQNVFLVTSSRHGGGEGGVQLHSFVTSAPDGGKFSTTRPGRFELGKENGTGGCVGLRAGLDILETRKLSCPDQDLNPGPSSP